MERNNWYEYRKLCDNLQKSADKIARETDDHSEVVTDYKKSADAIWKLLMEIKSYDGELAACQSALDSSRAENKRICDENERLKKLLEEERELSAFVAAERDRECDLRHKNEELLQAKTRSLPQIEQDSIHA